MRWFACLLLVPLLTPAAADAEFRFNPNLATFAVGPAMLDSNAGTTFYLHGRVDLAEFTDRLIWDTGLHWWRKTESESYTFFGSTTQSEVHLRDFALTSGVKYLFPVSESSWFPYGRAGLGLNFVNVSFESTTDGVVTSAADAGDTDLGLYLGAGAHYRYSSSVLLGAEASANVTDADHFLLGFTVSFPFGGGNSSSPSRSEPAASSGD